MTISVPKPYSQLAAALDDDRRDVVVWASPLSRVREYFLCWAMCRALASTRDRILYATATPKRDRSLLDSWLRGRVVPNLAVLDPGEWQDLPVARCTDLVVVDCDQLRDPSTWALENLSGRLRLVGTRPDPTHWFARAQPHHRIDVGTARAGGVLTADALLRARESVQPPVWQRRWELKGPEAERAVRFNVFARTRLKIRDKSGEIVPFRLRSIQRTYAAIKEVKTRELRAKGLPLHFLLLKYRRGGFTTFEQGKSYQTCATRANMQALTLAHTAKATAQIFRIAQLMWRLDAKRPEIKGVGNAQRLEFPDLNSQFFIGTASSPGEARGDTFQRVHGSEVSKWGKGPRRGDTVRDLVAGLTEAASHGEVVLETTPDGREWFYETYTAATRKQNLWTPIFLPWYWDPTNRMPEGTYSTEEVADTLTERERELIKQHRLIPAQVAWRRVKEKQLGPLMRQEYPEDDSSCFLSQGLCYFDVGTILDLQESTDWTLQVTAIPGGYEVEWEPPIPGEEYCVGTDTSEGVPKSDPCGFGVLHRRSGRQVAAVHGTFRPEELAAHSKRVARRYNVALLGVERNNHGHAVLVHLEDYPNLYYAEDGRPGWVTSTKTRPVMLSDLREALDEGLMKVRDRQLLDECLLFVKQVNGKYAGSPDDAVMKWAIAWQMRQYSPPKSDLI